jgi:hypothetical protein
VVSLDCRVLVSSFIFLSLLASAQDKASRDSGHFDGPAELPRIYLKSTLADTPAPGKSIPVKTSEALKTALNEAACGDTIRLEAGATFPGNFRIPPKNCDDKHWIILRTSTADSELPPEGSRITPCYAGVASLPGRPAFACSHPRNVMAKIVLDSKGSGPITIATGANHYRFIGLEITRDIPGSTTTNLVSLQGQGATADHFIFDRVWMHGTAQEETTRGILLAGIQYVGVVDSYFTDFHCIAVTGACTDSQTIAGGLGSQPMSVYKIVNNFLEASAENILFGGGGATLTPTDIEIRRNHLFKPPIWKRENPGFVGGLSGKPFIVKNLFELKNGQRVLLEANVLENTWGGFSQAGFAILLTPKNQNNACPLCKVTDVVVRFNYIAHMASAMQIATGLSDNGGASSGGERYSIHDNVFDDINGQESGGFGAFAQVSSSVPTLRDITIDHNTAFPSKALFILGVAVDREKITNFVFTNNLVGIGQADFYSTGGGAKNCAYRPNVVGPTGIIKSCFAGDSTFTHNVLIGSQGGWPNGNFYPHDASSLMENFGGGKGGDYRICRDKQSSQCKKGAEFSGKGSDRKDPGADIELLNVAIKGVK